MSIVSDSLIAWIPHLGQEVFNQSLASCNIIFLFENVILGKSTGSSLYGTGWIPQFEQWIIGIGVPQYLCLDINQSCNLELTGYPPIFHFCAR